MHYAHNQLYAGCNSFIAAWELNVQANICNFKDTLPTADAGAVIGLALCSDQLLYAQREGCYAAYAFVPEPTVIWKYFEKDVPSSTKCSSSAPWP